METEKENILRVGFRDNLRNMLIEAGVKPKVAEGIILSKYRDALKEHILSVLDSVTNLVKTESYNRILNTKLFYSPAGDGMGRDNYCINFADKCDDDPTDIYDIITELKEVKSLLDKNNSVLDKM